MIGERGDRGDRGILGERGPKGDHGQHGEQGGVGLTGEDGVRGATGLTGEQGPRGLPVSRWTQLAAYVVVVAVAAYSFYGISQTEGKVEKQSEATKAQGIGNCTRSNINSAIITLSSQSGRPGAISPKIAENLYPVLECRLTAKSGKGVALSDAEKMKFIKLVAQGRAPTVVQGKVVGSRDTVIPGIVSYPDVGKPGR